MWAWLLQARPSHTLDGTTDEVCLNTDHLKVPDVLSHAHLARGRSDQLRRRWRGGRSNRQMDLQNISQEL